jgi:SAM-dependent methyltransferase
MRLEIGELTDARVPAGRELAGMRSSRERAAFVRAIDPRLFVLEVRRKAMTVAQPTTPAEMYEHFFVPGIFGPLSRRVLAAARLRAGERVLDLACGTGILARQAATAVGSSGQVVGADLRPGMLAVAQALPPPAGASIEWRQADAHELPLEDARFDAVLCQQGLQFFADRPRALREMKRVGRPGGRVVLALWREFERHELFQAIAEVELRHLAEAGLSLADAMAPFSLASAEEVERLCTEAALRSIELTSLSIEARFPADNFIYNLEFAYAAVMPQFAENPARFRAYVEAVTQETEALLRRFTNAGTISFPLYTHVVTAHF